MNIKHIAMVLAVLIGLLSIVTGMLGEDESLWLASSFGHAYITYSDTKTGDNPYIKSTVRDGYGDSGTITQTTSSVIINFKEGNTITVDNGGLHITSLSGEGNAPLCVDSSGTPYRGNNTTMEC